MTLAIDAWPRLPSSAGSTMRRWRPRGPWDVCSLGWAILDWTHDCLPNPRDTSQRLVLTNEQARRVLRIYELDPVTGRRLYDRVHEEEAKGWGKGPFAAILGLAEFGGAPVVFDGWDADGQPVGKPWGSPGLPIPNVQVVAVSEAQTYNVWQFVMTLAKGARGELAYRITVDSGRPGRTMIRRQDIPEAVMERVTSSVASREGPPVIHGIFDETQLWLPDDGGDEVARVVYRNMTKTGGWVHFLANAPIEGLGSVAETWTAPDPEDLRMLHLATRPSEVPQPEWSDEQKRAALAEVFRDVPWADLDRFMADLRLPQVPWSEKVRFFFNVRTEGQVADAWMDADAWEASAGEAVLSNREPTYVCVRVAHDNRSAGVAIAQRQGDRTVLRCRTYTAREGEYVGAAAIERLLHLLRSRYRAPVFTERVVRGRKLQGFQPGPEILHHGAFFEPIRQRLAKGGAILVEQPSTPERLAPAAAALIAQVTVGALVHDGTEELARQMGRVVAKPTPKGWAVASGTGETIVAAQATMLAVQRALIAKRPSKPGPGRPRSRRGNRAVEY